MAISPNTDNYTLGKGVVYLDQLVAGAFTGERDLGNAPAFSFSIALEKLDHYSSRGGLKAKDKEIISQITPSLAFTLDEINKENFALLTLGSVSSVTQTAGGVVEEAVKAYKGKRSELAFRGLTFWTLPYDTGTGLFVAGEVVTGLAGATGVVTVVTGTAVAGTLTIVRTNATAFVDGEALDGSLLGAAVVNSLTGGALGIGTPVVLVQDVTDAITYTVGTDYEISTSLKDDTIGRIFIKENSTIVDGATIHVTYGHSALSYDLISAFANTQITGKLRFVSDNPAGLQQELQVWTVSLTPTGDTAMIGDDWSTLGFTGEILKDEVNHPTNPYMAIIMNQVAS
jgi:hypothetical protein